MRRNVVLIDFESVQPDTLEALHPDHFEVFLFCGASQTKIPFDIAASLQKLGARAQYIKIAGVGPNALDFHIAYYIGRVAAEDPSAFFHIVSCDKGFDPLIQHLKSQKVLAGRWPSIQEIPILKTSSLKHPGERAEAFLAKLKLPKTPRPKTEKALSNAIKMHLQLGSDEAEAAQILKAIVATGYLSIAEGKIVYAQPAG
ncbi:MAG: PIN domain-containing protein [Thermoanaerobaculia bacterium]|nr:PIN domain-containing protein [Thermoanaerobaculia bacterium]